MYKWHHNFKFETELASVNVINETVIGEGKTPVSGKFLFAA